jgi:hypothetical protein
MKFDRMLDKQDQMLDKQDQMLDKQDQMLDKQDQMLDKQDQTLQIARETKEEIVGLRSDTGSTSMTSSGISGGARLHQGGACPGRHPGLRHSLHPASTTLDPGHPRR